MLKNQTGDVMIVGVASITANFRNITQEAMSPIEQTCQIDAALTPKRDQKWIDEALASGPESPLIEKEMKDIRDRVLGYEK